jgi:hypothetical protein
MTQIPEPQMTQIRADSGGPQMTQIREPQMTQIRADSGEPQMTQIREPQMIDACLDRDRRPVAQHLSPWHKSRRLRDRLNDAESD